MKVPSTMGFTAGVGYGSGWFYQAKTTIKAIASIRIIAIAAAATIFLFGLEVELLAVFSPDVIS